MLSFNCYIYDWLWTKDLITTTFSFYNFLPLFEVAWLTILSITIWFRHNSNQHHTHHLSVQPYLCIPPTSCYAQFCGSTLQYWFLMIFVALLLCIFNFFRDIVFNDLLHAKINFYLLIVYFSCISVFFLFVITFNHRGSERIVDIISIFLVLWSYICDLDGIYLGEHHCTLKKSLYSSFGVMKSLWMSSRFIFSISFFNTSACLCLYNS